MGYGHEHSAGSLTCAQQTPPQLVHQHHIRSPFSPLGSKCQHCLPSLLESCPEAANAGSLGHQNRPRHVLSWLFAIQARSIIFEIPSQAVPPGVTTVVCATGWQPPQRRSDAAAHRQTPVVLHVQLSPHVQPHPPAFLPRQVSCRERTGIELLCRHAGPSNNQTPQPKAPSYA